MKRTIAILITLWTVLCGITAIIYFTPEKVITDGVTSRQDCCMSEDSIFVSENVEDHAVIYKMDKQGNRQGIFIARSKKKMRDLKVDAITYNQTLYALMEKPVVYDGRDVTGYQVVRLGENMAIYEVSDILTLGDKIEITHLSTDEKDIYISAVKSDRSEAYVYKLSQNTMHEYETGGTGLSDLKNTITGTGGEKKKDEEKIYPLDTMVFDVAENGRRFACYEYEPGQKYVRYDNKKPEDFEQVPEEIRSAYANYELSPVNIHRIKGVSFGMVFLVWCIGIPFIVVVYILMRGRNRAVYMGVVMEIALFAICALGCFSLMRSLVSVREQENRMYTQICVDDALRNVNLYQASSFLSVDETMTSDEKEAKLLDFYDSECYTDMAEALANQTFLMDTGWGIDSLAIVNRSTGEILVNDKRECRSDVSYIYGNTAGSFAKNVNLSSALRAKDVKYSGHECVLYAISLDRSGLSGYTLFAIARVREDIGGMTREYSNYIWNTVIIFLIASAFVIIFLFLESRDIHAIARMLKVLAEGRGALKNPKVHGRDLNAMKNSAFEIEKNITTVNRAKYKIFEAYYRFAPKSIEKMLGRDSITEVEIGDRVEISGTMAILSMKESRRADSESLAYMNKTFEIMEQRRSEHDGVYVTNNETLSRARILFPQDNHQAVSFGLDVLNSMREWKKKDYTDTLVLLHYTTFSYGICGTDTQCMALLASRETERLSNYAEWLRGLRLSLVITGTVLERERGFGEIRHIGFVRTDNNNRLELYEVLGAQINRAATAKRKTKDAFEAALRMFYDKDFYLARNAFTDILREAPEDELVKWYLFECETQLNGTAEEAFTGALHL